MCGLEGQMEFYTAVREGPDSSVQTAVLAQPQLLALQRFG